MGQFALRDGFCAKGRKDPVDLPTFNVKRALRVQWVMSGNGSTRALVLNSSASQIAILSSLVARNATFLLALI